MSAENLTLAERWSNSLGPVQKQGPEWLRGLRARSAEAFRESGLPDRKVESWRYTPLRFLEQENPELGDGSALPAPEFELPEPLLSGIPTVDIVDGALAGGFSDDLLDSLPKGVRIYSLQQAMENAEDLLRTQLERVRFSGRDKAFTALNTAQLDHGLVIHVAESVDAGTLLLRWAGATAHPALNQFRLMIVLEDSARLTLLEQFGGGHCPSQLLNLVTQVSLADSAEFENIRVQCESEQSVLLTSATVAQQAKSKYTHYGFDLGAGLARHETEVDLNGAEASVSLLGAFVLYGHRHVDNHLSVHHDAVDCRSEQFFRGVLGGRSRGVFNGRALIREGADGSSVKQSNANLLLSRHAEIDTKPELEIYADEVEASHGATVGQLDEAAIFYLRSRGLTEAEARRMLTVAFCQAVSDRISDRSLAEAVSKKVDRAMSRIEENAQ